MQSQSFRQHAPSDLDTRYGTACTVCRESLMFDLVNDRWMVVRGTLSMPSVECVDPEAERRAILAAAPDRDETIRRIRAALKERTGRAWSVTGGRGTVWGWITIHALPARREQYGYMTGDDQAILARALGLTRIDPQGQSIPAGPDYRVEYVDRAEGRTPSVVGNPYWD